MQGRLLPKYKGRYQAHPVGYWQGEFALAAEMGLDAIEFILDFNDIEANPLMSEGGIDEILSVSTGSGVSVKSVCADCFMEVPLHSLSEEESAVAAGILESLVGRIEGLGATELVIPCVDHSSLQPAGAVERFVQRVVGYGDLAGRNGISLCLETDLGPEAFADLLDRLGSPVFTVNYDTGNSTSLGYNAKEELAAYGDRVSDIHIKDRRKGGGSIELGTGDTDFDTFFDSLSPSYGGLFIMQAFRDDEGLAVFRRQLDWIRPKIEKWAASRKA
jgi:L-ribulose-5-phosphate 3-epimerase